MIQKLYEIMTKVGITRYQDKVLHVIAGMFMGAVSQLSVPRSIIPIFVAILIAIGKELYDKYIKKTYFDFFDMFATIAGIFVGAVVTLELLGI
ncbi:MAG: hypothetical protein PVI43_01075 [Candidatus Bathyarchaeota archaeon]|jgi:hypothetical protein